MEWSRSYRQNQQDQLQQQFKAYEKIAQQQSQAHEYVEYVEERQQVNESTQPLYCMNGPGKRSHENRLDMINPKGLKPQKVPSTKNINCHISYTIF